MDNGAPLGGDQDRGSTLIAISWAWASVSMIFVALRFYSRIRFARSLWHDDWWILVTLILTLTFTILWTIYATIGGCRHIFYLTDAQWFALTKINWISQPFCVMAIASGKVSVAYLILRLQAPCRWRTGLLYFIAVSSIILGAVDCVITFAQCSPSYALWTPNVTGSCWSTNVLTDYAMALSAYYAFLDIALALIPVTFVCSLQLSRKKKTSVCLLLSLGVCAGVCAIIKLTKLPELGARDDTTWNTTPLFIWNANEINLVIIAACIPSLRPLFVTLFGGTVSTPSSRSLSAPASRKKSLPIIVASHDHFHALQPLSRASTVDKYGWRDGDSEKETLPGNNITRTIDLDVESQHPRTSVHFHGDANKEASFVSGEREVVGIAY